MPVNYERHIASPWPEDMTAEELRKLSLTSGRRPKNSERKQNGNSVSRVWGANNHSISDSTPPSS